MLQIQDENVFIEKVKVGATVKPEKLVFIVVLVGSITFEINSFFNTYNHGNIVIISPTNIYKVYSYSDDLKLKLIIGEREEIKQKININFNRYDVYRASNTEKGYDLKFEESEFQTIINQIDSMDFYLKNISKILFTSEIIWLTFNSIMYAVFGKLLSNFDNESQHNSRKEQVVIDFIQLLSEHFKAEKELSFYANKLNISIKYLSNCVRIVTKTPPKIFIADKLLNEAKIALLDKELSIKYIASDLGFSDQYAFGKFFKKHTGFSPKNFKNQNTLITTL